MQRSSMGSSGNSQHCSRNVLLRISRTCNQVAGASVQLSCTGAVLFQLFAGSFPHADSQPSLEPLRCPKVFLPSCKLRQFRTDAESILSMQKRTYCVIGNPVNSSDMLSHTR